MAPLGVNVTDGTNAQFYEVSDDTSIEDFKCILLVDFGKDGDELADVQLGKGGRPLGGGPNATLGQVGVQNGDMLLFLRKKAVAAMLSNLAATASQSRPSAATSQAPTASPATVGTAASSSSNPQNMQAHISNLVKSIKLPPNMMKKRAAPTEEDRHLTEARQLFEAMERPAVQARFEDVFPPLVEQYRKDSKNFNEFARVFKECMQEQLRKAALMNDPTSEEGQRLLEEKIRRENIDHSYEMALEHNPEAYIAVDMLFINMTINGHPVKAFIDSGAQVSVMSLACARRCNLEHLIDKRFQGTVRGVGGQQNFAGKIHMCQVQVENHFFPCYFDVLADRDMDLLLGLNILRRHQCVIDLKQNKLLFGDGTSTAFLGDAEVKAYKEQHGLDTGEVVEVDAGKLAELVAMGWDEAEASEALKTNGNDLEMAAQKLISKKEQSGEEQMQH